jgi:hypothetical protein
MTMVAVLASCVVMMTVVLGSAAFLSASTKYSRYEQDSDRAQAAAQSGVNMLLAELRANPNYLAGLEGSGDKDHPYCVDAATGQPWQDGKDNDVFSDDCGWDASTKDVGWRQLGEAIGEEQQWYHYAVTYHDSVSETVEVVSTGKSRNVVRSLKARLAPTATPMYLYISNYELADPTDYTAYTNNEYYAGGLRTSAACGAGWVIDKPPTDLSFAWEIAAAAGTSKPKTARHFTYDGLARHCYEPTFTKHDVLDGKVHSNDTIRADQTQFGGEFTTANLACKGAKMDPGTWNNCVSGTAHFDQQPTWTPSLALPSPQPADQESATGKGCRYEGATRIVLEGEQMRVWSKNTTTDRPGCGTPAQLQHSDGALVDLPPDGLVFVGNADGVSPKLISAGGIGDGLPLGTYDATKGPSSGATYTVEPAMEEPSRYAGLGNVYVEGEAHGHLTIATAGSIVITGDLLTEDDSEDLLGLIAGGSVEIFNPALQRYNTFPSYTIGAGGTVTTWNWTKSGDPEHVTGWPKDYDGRDKVLRIEAALHATAASFRLQNWKLGGPLGVLEVHGSIAQNFRGVVAWETQDGGSIISGYEKQYTYNEALNEGRPLLFSPIQGGSWSVPWVEKVEPDEVLKP